MPLGLISALLKEAGSSGVVTALSEHFKNLATCENAAALAEAAGQAPEHLLLWTVALGGGAVIEMFQGHRQHKDMREQFARVHRALAKVDVVVGDLAQSAKRIVDALLSEGVILGDIAQDVESLRRRFDAFMQELRRQNAATTSHLDDIENGVRIYLSNMSADLRKTLDNTLDILSDTQQMKAGIESLAAQIAAMQRGGDPAAFSRLEGENAELRATVQRYVEAERARGRPWREVVEELRHDPARLGAFIDDETERADRELVERHRERAAVWYTLGDIDKSLASVKTILALAEDDLFALNHRGRIHRLRGQLNAAADDLRRVGELATDDAARAVSLGNLGLIERTRGNLNAAEEYLKQSLAIEERLGHPEGMAANYGNLGLVELARGNQDAAETYLKKSLAINERLGRPEGMANQYGNLGGIEQARGNLDAACRLWTQARDLFRRIGAKDREALVQSWLDKHCPNR